MEHRGADAAWPVAQHSRFELAPPRRFLLPALLLLLSEEPGYGYNLAKGLEDLRFGRVDRPSVYRALAQLERDGLVESWAGTPKAGQARRVYGLTEEGQRALRGWMGVIKQERDCLDLVLRRYVATGTVDAALAEAEGGWAAVTGHPWSPVSATSRIERHRHGIQPAVPVRRRREVVSNGRDEPAVPAPFPERVDARPVRRRPGSLGDPDRGPLDRRTDHLRRGRRDRGDRGRGPRRPGAAGRGRRPRTWRSR